MPPPKNRRVSQQTIARELGVSQALVSMVLNGRRDGISDEAFSRIWALARTYGYTPRGMRLDLLNTSRAPLTVGYILRSPLRLATKSNFFSHVHHGLHDALKGSEIRTVFLGTESDLNPNGLVDSLSAQTSMIGIVVMGEVSPGFLSTLTASGKPIVYIAARSPGLCHSIVANERQAAQLLIDHLVGLGHRTFAWIGGNVGKSRNAERHDAVEEALRQHKLSLPASSVVEITAEADRKDGYAAAAELLSRRHRRRPTAWICMNGLTARGAINFLLQKGVKVPADCSVVAFDHTRVCTEEHPEVTGASACPETMGAEAAKVILANHHERSSTLLDLVMPSELITRESTAEAAVAAVEPARAS